MTIWDTAARFAGKLGLSEPFERIAEAISEAIGGGHHDEEPGEPEPADRHGVAFAVAVIALGAKMAKADGVVRRDEVEAFKRVFEIDPQHTKGLERAFDVARKEPVAFHVYAKKLAHLFEDEPGLLEDVIDGLFHIARSDGEMHEAELRYMRQVAGLFEFDEADFASMRARHQNPLLSDPYVVLGLERGAGLAEAEAARDRLILANSADAVAARGVPNEFHEIARFKREAINAAYERIAGGEG